MSKKKLLVIIINHFDLAWRRCFDRKIEFEGKFFVSYIDLQKYNILGNLKLAQQFKGYKFNVETVAVMRNFLERNPEKLPEIKKLFEEGRLYIPLSGDNIIDTNMVLGESIIRNFLTGMLWTEENFNYTPRQAVRNDAFGNSAQLPQILRGCGIKWVTGLSYSSCKGKYWRGLDGSIVLQETLPGVGNGGGWKKYAPCPDCCGTGEILRNVCKTCEGLGIDREWMGESIYNIQLNENAFGNYDAGFVTVGGEELIPSIKTIEWVNSQQDAYDVSFAVLEEAYPYVENLLNNMENLDEYDFHNSVELNPNNTGCYVTRIKTKQIARRQEYALLNLEVLAALSSILTRQYPKTELKELWRKLFFTLAHDSITGEHVDDVYFDLQEIWPEIDAGINALFHGITEKAVKETRNAVSVLNLTGDRVTEMVSIERENSNNRLLLLDEEGNRIKPVEISKTDNKVIFKLLIKDIQPFTSKIFNIEQEENPVDFVDVDESKNSTTDKLTTLVTAQTNILQTSENQQTTEENIDQTVYCIENDRYIVEADRFGLISIFDKKINRIISKATEYRPGEYILEHDEGSPWATLSKDMARIPLSKFTRLMKVAKEDSCQRMTFRIVDMDVVTSYAINAFRIEYSVTLYEGLDRIEFQSNVRWDDYNHRLKVAMPVNAEGCYKYEIPYGILDRKSYEPSFYWAGSSGDWPAINWAGVESDHFSAALLNKGTPSYRMEKSKIEGETMFLSVLRSPCIPTYLHEPDSYSMTKWDGMRDSGKHSFEYALVSYDTAFCDSSVVADANIYNNGLYAVSGRLDLPFAPQIISDNVRISSIKKGEKDDSLIVRLVEYRGRVGKVGIKVPKGFSSVYQVNLLEREPLLLERRENDLDFEIKPFEITTLKFE